MENITPSSEKDTPIEDIQSDFEIVLKLPKETDCYPFLKKFSTSLNFREETFFNEMRRVFDFEKTSQNFQRVPTSFCIDFSSNKISWIYYNFISTRHMTFERQVHSVNEIYKKIVDEQFFDLLKSYILFQLKNCGYFDELRRISVNTNNKLYFHINIHSESIKSTNFHHDSAIFQMLQYFNFNSGFVLSSELMLYSTPDTKVIHRGYDRFEKSYPHYGKRTNDASNMINGVFERLKSNPGLLRGKYNNGDTLSWSDCLLKHAVINPKEKFINTQIQTDVKIIDGNELVMVNVCSLRIETNESHYKGRKLIGINIIYDELFDTKTECIYELSSFDIDFTDIDKLDIPLAEFDEDNCFDFFQSISEGRECIQINTERPMVVKTRGGKNKKIQKRKRTARKRTIRKQTIRKQSILKRTIRKQTIQNP